MFYKPRNIWEVLIVGSVCTSEYSLVLCIPANFWLGIYAKRHNRYEIWPPQNKKTHMVVYRVERIVAIEL